MLSIISLLIILTLSLLVTRIASIALSHTGLSKESARFQARSAFTGVGFTTNESERVVNHPVRRRILLLLMLLGNAGIVTAISTFILTFIDFKASEESYLEVLLLVSGLAALLVAAQSSWIDRRLSRLINLALKRYSKLNIKDYAGLLQLAGEYGVSELQVKPEDWLVNKQLINTKLSDEGILVLGIHRDDGKYVGAPRGDTKIRAHDILILYGRESVLASLDQRKKGFWGDREHEQVVEEQKKIEEEEKQSEETEEKDEQNKKEGGA